MSRKRCGFNKNGEAGLEGPLRVPFGIIGHRRCRNTCPRPPVIERIDGDAFLSGNLVNRLTMWWQHSGDHRRFTFWRITSHNSFSGPLVFLVRGDNYPDMGGPRYRQNSESRHQHRYTDFKNIPIRRITSSPVAHADVALICELDEQWSFVGGKARQHWLWYAWNTKKGGVLAYTFGPRNDETCRELLSLLTPFNIGMITSVSASDISP
ncbi:hypothetical protein SMQE31_46360 (plasmid) [Serratia marcescens]|nr:hypothetical protein SMQE31_46360 [Serratia marcescens]